MKSDTTEGKKERPRLVVDLSQRAAFTPAEFAAQFGKGETWGYRRIYDGSVKVIKGYGTMLIPRSEVDRLLQSAGAYTS